MSICGDDDEASGLHGFGRQYPRCLVLKLLAQQPQRISRVALLMALSESDPEGAACVKAFRRGLQELRWEEGVNLQIDVRWASRSTQKEHAEELLAIAPKVAVAHGTPAVHAVRNRLSTLPIVFVQVADPVQQGIVANLSHPGGNITGFMGFEFTIAGKWLQILKKVRLKLLTWQ